MEWEFLKGRGSERPPFNVGCGMMGDVGGGRGQEQRDVHKVGRMEQ